jgi:transposase-like protein
MPALVRRVPVELTPAVEGFIQERGVAVDHSTINRWVLRYSPHIEAAFHHRKHPVGMNWRMGATYIRVRRSIIPAIGTT